MFALIEGGQDGEAPEGRIARGLVHRARNEGFELGEEGRDVAASSESGSWNLRYTGPASRPQFMVVLTAPRDPGRSPMPAKLPFQVPYFAIECWRGQYVVSWDLLGGRSATTKPIAHVEPVLFSLFPTFLGQVKELGPLPPEEDKIRELTGEDDGDPSNSALEWFKRGMAAHATRRFTDAVASYDQAIALGTTDGVDDEQDLRFGITSAVLARALHDAEGHRYLSSAAWSAFFVMSKKYTGDRFDLHGDIATASKLLAEALQRQGDTGHADALSSVWKRLAYETPKGWALHTDLAVLKFKTLWEGGHRQPAYEFWLEFSEVPRELVRPMDTPKEFVEAGERLNLFPSTDLERLTTEEVLDRLQRTRRVLQWESFDQIMQRHRGG